MDWIYIYLKCGVQIFEYVYSVAVVVVVILWLIFNFLYQVSLKLSSTHSYITANWKEKNENVYFFFDWSSSYTLVLHSTWRTMKFKLLLFFSISKVNATKQKSRFSFLLDFSHLVTCVQSTNWFFFQTKKKCCHPMYIFSILLCTEWESSSAKIKFKLVCLYFRRET